MSGKGGKVFSVQIVQNYKGFTFLFSHMIACSNYLWHFSPTPWRSTGCHIV